MNALETILAEVQKVLERIDDAELGQLATQLQVARVSSSPARAARASWPGRSPCALPTLA
jgi:tetrahydromethanopterin S-methyltransferase subunit B